MSQPITKKSSSLVPPKDQLRTMCKTLKGLEADPAISMGITAAAAYTAYMAAADSPASSSSSNRSFRVSLKPQDTVTSSPVPSPKTGKHKNGSKKSRKPAEITSDLCTGNLNATSIAPPPADTPSAVTQEPCPTKVPTATKEVETKFSDQRSSPPVTNANASCTSSQTKESCKPTFFLGPWSLPKGADGKGPRWRLLQDNYPALAHLGAPIRSSIETEDHTGQLRRAQAFNGEWKPYSLTPEEQALRDQRERQKKARLAGSVECWEVWE
ncbi:hypothetical protein C7212DRAFT_341055 [Tuber magnatum]|uniref:Uncharacterized protein n=1 Tax=Tuber magnatum TaxID=42249 RepID=A0A317SZR5_9PEZI|nr:hypothetical protein C7212DRAFT_341055 [Tuber magnatum]